MKKIRICDLADELKVERKALLAQAQGIGIPAKSTTKGLTEKEVEQLKALNLMPSFSSVVEEVKAEEGKGIESEKERGNLEKVREEGSSPVESVPPFQKSSQFKMSFQKRQPFQKKNDFQKGKKKKWFERLKQPPERKVRGLKLLAQPKVPRYPRFSVRHPEALIVGGVGFLLLSNLVLLGLVASGYRPTHRIIHESVSATSSVRQSEGMNWEAKNYLDGFVQTYFTFPEAEDDQEAAVKAMNAYFVQKLPVESQGLERSPSKFEQAVLMKLTAHEATYQVTYQAGKVTTKEVKEGNASKKEKGVDYQEEKTVFTIPYQKVGGSYYVSDEPYFSSLPDLQAQESEVPIKSWSETDQVSESEKKNLDQFTKSLFTAYTKDGETLKLISKGLPLNQSESFVSLDRSTYEEKGAQVYQAIVQVTMKNALGTHVENYQFRIEKQKASYFATDFKHTLPNGKKA